jgi:hypothetical protein
MVKREGTMRRLAVLIVVVLTVGAISGSASASTLRVRVDANDSSSNLDIHKVITNLSDSTMYLGLRSWERFRLHELRAIWVFSLDTYGTGKFDREVQVGRANGRLFCLVVDAHTGRLIGHRGATRPDRRSAACHLPRGWFGHIHRAVRFRAIVIVPSSGKVQDRAPNHGVYRFV